MPTQKIMLTNIQRFSLHDGPGIRTTVFLKGCSLCCPWCCNPENLVHRKQKYLKEGITGTYGSYYDPDSLYNELIKDKAFYIGKQSNYSVNNPFDFNKLPGGVTFSGGEALLQIKQIEPLLQRLDFEHIHTAVETCLFVSPEQLELSMRYIDLFYVDIKILDKNKCKAILHGDLSLYLNNLEILFKYKDNMGYNKPIIIRIPVIGGYTDDDANRKEIIKLLHIYKPLKVELVKEHNLGVVKYRNLKMQAVNLNTVTDELMEMYKKEVESIGIWTEVCKV